MYSVPLLISTTTSWLPTSHTLWAFTSLHLPGSPSPPVVARPPTPCSGHWPSNPSLPRESQSKSLPDVLHQVLHPPTVWVVLQARLNCLPHDWRHHPPSLHRQLPFPAPSAPLQLLQLVPKSVTYEVDTSPVTPAPPPPPNT